jgi:hypothetical protein
LERLERDESIDGRHGVGVADIADAIAVVVHHIGRLFAGHTSFGLLRFRPDAAPLNTLTVIVSFGAAADRAQSITRSPTVRRAGSSFGCLRRSSP